MIEEQGGFGLFQLIIYLLFVVSLNTQGVINYNYTYLLLYPKFECYNTETGLALSYEEQSEKCQPHHFCEAENGIGYTIDYEDEITLSNWIEKFDLICAGKFIISSFAMFYFMGFCSGSMLIPRMGDLYGRKKIFCASLFLQLMTLVSILLVPGGSSKNAYFVVLALFF